MALRGLGASLGLAFLLTTGAPTFARTAPSVHRVVIDRLKFGFVPGHPRVGDVILWENRDIFQHTATGRDGSFNIDLPPAKSGRIVLRRAGTIKFYCRYHPGMTGQFSVAKQ